MGNNCPCGGAHPDADGAAPPWAVAKSGRHSFPPGQYPPSALGGKGRGKGAQSPIPNRKRAVSFENRAPPGRPDPADNPAGVAAALAAAAAGWWAAERAEYLHGAECCGACKRPLQWPGEWLAAERCAAAECASRLCGACAAAGRGGVCPTCALFGAAAASQREEQKYIPGLSNLPLAAELPSSPPQLPPGRFSDDDDSDSDEEEEEGDGTDELEEEETEEEDDGDDVDIEAHAAGNF